jgi:predicted nucleotidyltransferase
MTQKIRLIHGTDHIKRLAQRPDVANAVRQIRTDMAVADYAYAEPKFFGYTREQFTENVPPTPMAWEYSTRILSSSRPNTVLFPGYMVHDWGRNEDMAQTAAPPLLPVFRSRLQGDLLALVLGAPAAEWTAEELSQRTGYPRHTVANELRRLEEAGLFTARTIGRSKLTRANTDNPYYEPLSRLALMSFGPPQVIREELGTIDHIEQLFIFGSWAARYAGEQGPAPHDVDVLIIGAPDRDEVYEAARRAQERLGHEVNTTIRKAEQWRGAQDGFARQVRSSPIVQIPLPDPDR